MDSDNSNKTNETDTLVSVYDANQDDDFKKLLVRKVARAVKKKNVPIKLCLEKLQSNLGKDCKKLWNQMVMSTTEKLKNLIEANDILRQGDTTMHLSDSEWLLYDLMLVHEKINVAGTKDMLECLNELYRLVQFHDVENLTGDKLANAWIKLTLEYNIRGRMVSPMLLQRCWYQLKETARKKVFDQIEGLSEGKIKLLHSIAIKYQKIITHPYPAWQLLIKHKRVILADQFVEILNQENKWKLEECELWYLKINRELHDSLINKNVDNSIPKTINLDNNFDNGSCKKSKDSLSIDLPKSQHDDGLLKQLISEKMEQYHLNTSKPIDLLKKRNNNDPVKEVKSKEKEPHHLDIPKPTSKSKDTPLLLDTDDEVDTISDISAVTDGVSENIIENTTYNTEDTTFGENSTTEVTKTKIVKRKNYLVVEKTDYLNKDIEFKNVDKNKRQKNKSDTGTLRYGKDGNMKKKYIDNDTKLRMKAIVSTKKLDNMKVFKHVVYDVVNDKKVIECALTESKPIQILNKPILEHVSRDKDDGVTQNILGGKIISELIENTNDTTDTPLMPT